MTSEIFTASTQYNDLRGSSSADRTDLDDATQWLRGQEHLYLGELLVGIEAYLSPSGAPQNSPLTIDVTFVLIKSDSFENLPDLVVRSDSVAVRKVNLEMTPDQFFRLFKRFCITLSSKGILEGHEIHTP